MIALALVAAGVVAFAAGMLAVRGFGPGYRVARILRAAPEVDLAAAEAAARAGRRAYVRVHGRISSDEEFPDEQDRPLVYRRRRVQVLGPAGWESLEDERTAVPFGVAARGVYVGVDVDVLDEGLVVLPRQSEGTAGDVPGAVPAGTPPDRPVRLRIEQVSAVEHAYLTGQPVMGPDGRAMLTAGAGRPLIVSTLDLPAAMRILGGANRRRALAAVALLVAGPALAAIGLVWGVAGPTR